MQLGKEFRNFEYEGQKSDILDNAFVIVSYANGAGPASIYACSRPCSTKNWCSAATMDV